MSKILFLQRQPCVRTLKYASALRSSRGAYELGFAYQGESLSGWYGEGDELFNRWWRLEGEPAAELRRIVAEFRPDVIHSHNLPDRLTVTAIDALGGAVPIVHDVHDLQSLRQTPYEDGFAEPLDPGTLEKRAIVEADAVVAVSPEMLAEISARYGLPTRALCFPSYALGRSLPVTLAPVAPLLDRPPRIVYQGTLSTNGGHYDLRAIFVEIVREGALLDIYPARPAPDYEALAAAHAGMTCRRRLAPRELMQALPSYDFGWAGFNAALNRAHLDTALPNKLFDYLGCGLPVLTLGHLALARFVAEEKVGACLPTLAGLAGQLAALDTVVLRRSVAAARRRFTVEANIGAVAGLYDDLLAG